MSNLYYIMVALIATSLLGHAQGVAEKPSEEKQDQAKLEHPAEPFLWKVEGKGLEKPSYLFGTMHVNDPRVTNLHPAVEEAFTGADTLAVETVPSPEDQQQMAGMFMREDGKTLQEELGEELWQEIDGYLQSISPQFRAERLNPMRSWASIFALMEADRMKQMMEMQKNPEKFADLPKHQGPVLDALLTQRAAKKEKKVWGLESSVDQMKAFGEFTLEEQKDLLRGMLQFFDEPFMARAENQQKIVKAYLAGDSDKVYELDVAQSMRFVKNEALEDRFKELIIVSRSERMAKKAMEILQAEPGKSHFVAAGTTHMTMDHGGLPALLKDAGYTITRVE